MESYYNANASNNRCYRNPGSRPCNMQRMEQRNQCRQNTCNNSYTSMQSDCNSCAKTQSDCNSCNSMPEKKMPSKTIRDNHGKSMEVECVCRVNKVKSCHTNDPMDQLGCRFPVVMAYVPWQQWGELYEQDCALMQGTVFKDLNKIFCGVRC